MFTVKLRDGTRELSSDSAQKIPAVADCLNSCMDRQSPMTLNLCVRDFDLYLTREAKTIQEQTTLVNAADYLGDGRLATTVLLAAYAKGQRLNTNLDGLIDDIEQVSARMMRKLTFGKLPGLTRYKDGAIYSFAKFQGQDYYVLFRSNAPPIGKWRLPNGTYSIFDINLDDGSIVVSNLGYGFGHRLRLDLPSPGEEYGRVHNIEKPGAVDKILSDLSHDVFEVRDTEGQVLLRMKNEYPPYYPTYIDDEIVVVEYCCGDFNYRPHLYYYRHLDRAGVWTVADLFYLGAPPDVDGGIYAGGSSYVINQDKDTVIVYDFTRPQPI